MSATAERRPGFLADVIVELGLAEQEEVDQARSLARLEGRTLSDVLVENGTLGERDLARAVAERHELPMVDLDSFPVDPEAAGLVGQATARRYCVAPAGFASDGALLLAMADPTDSLARNDVAVSTRLEVRPVIAPRGQITKLIEALPERQVTHPKAAESEKEAVSGSLLWQSDKSSAPDDPDGGEDALEAAERRARDHPRGERIRGGGSDLEKRVESLCEQLSKRDSQLARLRDEVAGLEEAIARHDAQLAERDAQLAERGEQLAERDSQLAERDSQLAERDTQLTERDAQLAERDAQVAECDAQVAKLKESGAHRDKAMVAMATELAAAQREGRPPQSPG